LPQARASAVAQNIVILSEAKDLSVDDRGILRSLRLLRMTWASLMSLLIEDCLVTVASVIEPLDLLPACDAGKDRSIEIGLIQLGTA
jgi:hypothetical protein